MHDLACELAREAGAMAVAAKPEELNAAIKGLGNDVVTAIDIAAERRIAQRILATYPDHAVIGEEHGRQGLDDAQFRWLVDPLDGTNNFVLGLPMYGVCITVCDGDDPVVAVVHNSTSDITCSAIRGEGARIDRRPPTPWIPAPPGSTTISWSQGYAVTWDDPARTAVHRTLETKYKRVLSTWAPSIDWQLLVSGQTGGYVLYGNEPHDLLGGRLICEEAGCESWTSADGNWVIAAWPDAMPGLREACDNALERLAAP